MVLKTVDVKIVYVLESFSHIPFLQNMGVITLYMKYCTSYTINVIRYTPGKLLNRLGTPYFNN